MITSPRSPDHLSEGDVTSISDNSSDGSLKKTCSPRNQGAVVVPATEEDKGSAAIPLGQTAHGSNDSCNVIRQDSSTNDITKSKSIERSEDEERLSLHRQNSITDHSYEDLKRIFEEITANELSTRRRLYHILFANPAMGMDVYIARIYNTVHLFMVALSVVLFLVMSMPDFFYPDIRPYGAPFVIEAVTVVFFTVDFVLRQAVALKWSQRINLAMFVDFLSFVGFYIELIIHAADSQPSSAVGLLLLRALKLGRVFRLFKVARSQQGFTMLMDVVAKSKDGLFLLIVLVVIATLICASVMYYIEQISCIFDRTLMRWVRPDGTLSPFQSIPQTFWFVSVSITTVGYGDEYPFTIWGRMWVVVVMLFGVLVLSFPNILIGSNFSDVHKAQSRARARKQLGIYFRRVRMVVRFVRMWREFRVKGRIWLISGKAVDKGENGSTAGINVRRRMNNFMFRVSDFPDRYLSESTERAALGNLDQIQHTGLTLLSVMQRLLEVFSGCATISELKQSYTCFPSLSSTEPVTLSAVFEVVIRGAASQFLSFFVLSREAESGLVIISKRGVDTLQNFTENGSLPCMRCYAEAREIWMQTVKQAPYDYQTLDGYKSWQLVQAKTRKRAVVDFAYDLKTAEAKNNDIFAGVPIKKISDKDSSASKSRCSCRYCNPTWGLSAPMRPTSDYCFNPDEEFLTLELTYVTQSIEILRLEKKVSSLSGAVHDTMLEK